MSGCVCGHETTSCLCGHQVRQHVMAAGGTLACPVHGRMGRCQVCDCAEFSHQVTRTEIDELIASVPDGEHPRWVRAPRTPSEFFAALLLHAPAGVQPVYDSDGTLTSVRGLQLKDGQS